MSLPAADDLFRPTVVPEEVPGQVSGQVSDRQPTDAQGTPVGEAGGRQHAHTGARKQDGKQPSGRIRHDEKMTVYVTAEELLDLEHTRLALRTQGVSVDRGRLVREAVAIALADFEANGHDSLLARRLTGS